MVKSHLTKMIFMTSILRSLAACQTVPEPLDVELPVAILDQFDSCQNGDGELQVAVSRDGQGKGQVDFDWVIKGKGQWIGEIYNPLGQTILQLAYTSGPDGFTTSGPMKSELPPIEVRKDGFVEVDGYFTGLKAVEVACFFKFKFPRDWLDHATGIKRGQDSIALKIVDSERRILMNFADLGDRDIASACATISWDRFFGLSKSSYAICQYGPDGRRQLRLDGVGHYSLQAEEKRG